MPGPRQDRTGIDPLNQHGVAHGAGGGNGNFLSGLAQFLDFFANQNTELMKCFFFGSTVAHTAPRKHVGAMADITAVLLAP